MERPQTFGRKGEVSFQHPLELQEWFVIEHDIVNLIETDTFLGKTIFDGMGGKACVVLPAAEALLLCGRNYLTIADQRRRAVMVKSGNTENSQGGCSDAASRHAFES